MNEFTTAVVAIQETHLVVALRDSPTKLPELRNLLSSNGRAGEHFAYWQQNSYDSDDTTQPDQKKVQ